ncbi:cation:proton antiporter [Pontibacterium sp.]|uniref:cation:proton antiporter n=1 Tax=Pontibacterium sp. TaxID=2036026 RepID=UPI003519B5AE
MNETAELLLALGGILLAGLATDLAGRATLLPRVTLLLILGVLIGPELFNLIPNNIVGQFELIAEMTLLMVGFLLGGRLKYSQLKRDNRMLLGISTIGAVGTALFVGVLLLLFGVPLPLAILLGCIASATAPAATVDTVLSTEHTGRFPRLLLGIVALDDAWGLVLFSFGLSLVAMLNGQGSTGEALMLAVHDVGGAVVLGLAIGIPAAQLTGRISPGQPMLTEALGLVFLCGGLAEYYDVSFLISSMVMGAVIANLAKHHDYPFHAIEGISWPLFAIFFVLAGASLELAALSTLSGVALLYMLGRTAGKILSGWLGASISGAPAKTARWIGVAMLPQAGAAMGMALVAASHYPEYGQTLLSLVIGSTIIFEIIGPVMTRWAMMKNRD